jgi:tetratricopeptide (TPR) repeat protein
MQYGAIVKVIIEKGVDNITLPETIKFQSLTDAGRILFKAGRHSEAGKAFAKANNNVDLESYGNYLMQQVRPWEATHYFLHSQNEIAVMDCATQCMELGHLAEAKILFKKLNDNSMLQFLEQNFGA